MEIQSQYFKLNEFLISQDAARFGIDNTPNDIVIINLQWLCDKILDPLREKLNKPICISSGYRSIALNLKEGGTQNPISQHTMGKAADIYCPGMTPKELANYIINQTELPFDQIILEFSNWVHISFDHNKVQQRGDKLQINVGTNYLPYKG
jgi:zinc D-Ala-D-Ala carboxypeptidase